MIGLEGMLEGVDGDVFWYGLANRVGILYSAN